MTEQHKIIRDSIHGDIKLEGVFLDLLETPEIQRLYNIKQLGLAHLVFPGAHHTRLEHSLGAYHTASQAVRHLNVGSEDEEVVRCAALLHDIGHGPFSHTLESILRTLLDADHVDLTEKLLLDTYQIADTKEKNIIASPSVSEVLEQHQVNTTEVANVIRGRAGKKPFRAQLLNSAIDVDQLDYLIRDAYYTGVAYGMIDIERFLQTLLISQNNHLAIKRKGVGVVENILMARALMYSSVYFHKTVRIAELMLSKSLELVSDLDPFQFFKMTDAELMNALNNMGPFQQEIAIRLKYRKLFKQAYWISASQLDKDRLELVKALEDNNLRRAKEQEIENQFNIPEGHIIIDVPYRELHLAEPRISQTDIMIDDKNQLKSLDEFTPTAEAIRARMIPDWSIMIVTNEKFRENVSKNAERILFR
ncbi:MAG: HD domain-containing protein [Candidatus Thermoplasmatota archaeon]|nr:HD domain-containing protein [Candidatus Thermoplasmatota archaeon]